MNKVLCFGSLNIDYVYNVEHFVRGGETISSLDMNIHAGGKGLNQAVALSKADADTWFAGKTGEDKDFLLSALKQSGVNTDLVGISQKKSGHAIIQVDPSGQNCIMIYGGANKDITTDYIDNVLNFFNDNDYLVLQNEINNIPYILKKASEKGIKIVFNPSPLTEDLNNYPLGLVDFFVLNEIEGEELTGKNNEKDIIKELSVRFPKSKIILTLGKNGAIYADKNNIFRQGIYDVPVVDTTAAGDTFTGYFISEYIKTASPVSALKYAAAASSVCVSRAGASPSIPDRKEVESFLSLH
jgi:ribokinase